MSESWLHSGSARRMAPGQVPGLPEDPILGQLDGTYRGRLVVEAWRPNDPSMADGLWYTVAPVESFDDGMRLAGEVVTKLQSHVHHWSPREIPSAVPTMGQMDGEGKMGGRLLGHLVAEAWRLNDADGGADLLYGVVLVSNSGVTPLGFAADTVHRLQRRLERQGRPQA